MYKQNLCSTVLLIEDMSSVWHDTDTSDYIQLICIPKLLWCQRVSVVFGVYVSVLHRAKYKNVIGWWCLTAIEKDAYESALLWQTSRAPNGPPFSSHIAGIITIGKPPMLPCKLKHNSWNQTILDKVFIQ